MRALLLAFLLLPSAAASGFVLRTFEEDWEAGLDRWRALGPAHVDCTEGDCALELYGAIYVDFWDSPVDAPAAGGDVVVRTSVLHPETPNLTEGTLSAFGSTTALWLTTLRSQDGVRVELQRSGGARVTAGPVAAAPGPLSLTLATDTARGEVRGWVEDAEGAPLATLALPILAIHTINTVQLLGGEWAGSKTARFGDVTVDVFAPLPGHVAG